MKLERIEYTSLNHNSQVKFCYDDNSSLVGYVRYTPSCCFINIPGASNDYIYKKLPISNDCSFADFVESIVGYPVSGGWPEVKNINDLSKVLNALLAIGKSTTKENKDNIIKVHKHKTVKLNFNL